MQGEPADSFQLIEETLAAGDSVTVELPANGGFVATLRPQ